MKTRDSFQIIARRIVRVSVCCLLSAAPLSLSSRVHADPCTASFQANLGSGAQNLTSGYVFPIRGSATISWTPAGSCVSQTATKIALYKVGGSSALWAVDTLTTNSYVWDPIARPSGFAADQKFFFRVTFDGHTAPTADSEDFYIQLPLTIDHPTASESYDEYGSMYVAWSMQYGEDADRYTVRLLNSDKTICQTLWQSYDGLSNTWNSVTPCSESAATYYIRIVWINGADKDSVLSPQFTIRPCQVALARASGLPTSLAIYCQSQISGQTVFAVDLSKGDGPSATVASLKVTVASGSNLFGTYKYQVGSGTETSLTINATGVYTIPINQAIGSSPVRVVLKTYSFTSPPNAGTMNIDLLQNSDVVFNGSYSGCAATGAPILGVPLSWERRPRPTAALGDPLAPVTIWCDAGSGQNPTVGLEPTFGESNGKAYDITGIRVADVNGLNFNYIQEIAVYKGATKYLYATPGNNVTSVNLTSGTAIPVSANSSDSYQIKYTWKSAPPSSPTTYVPKITSVTSSPSSYCSEQGDPADPFSVIYNISGRQMTRSPSGGIAATLNSGNPTTETSMCSSAAAPVLMLKVDLAATYQDMEVDQLTFTARPYSGTDNTLFSYFSSISVKNGGTTYTNTSPGNTSVTTVSTVANGSNPQLVVPVGGSVTLEVSLTPKTSIAGEPHLRLELTGTTFSGGSSGDLSPDPCDGDYTYSGSNLYGRYLQLYSTPTLATPVFSDLSDVFTCAATRTDVMSFSLTAANYVDEAPKLSTIEYSLDEGQYSWASEIRLYKDGTSTFVVDADMNGAFDDVEDENWSLTSTASVFRIAVTPVASTLETVVLRPRLETIGAIDADGCTITALQPDHVDAALHYKKKAVLTVTKSDIGTGQRSVCSVDDNEQSMLSLSFQTDASETASLQSLSLDCLLDNVSDWSDVDAVRVYSGATLLDTSGTSVVTFTSPPSIPSAPATRALDIRFVFDKNDIQYDKGYKAKMTSCVAKGTVSGGADFNCGNLAAPTGGPWTEASTLVFRPAGALTVDLSNYPTSWTIPNETQQPQIFAKDNISASSREDIQLLGLSYSECNDPGNPQPLSTYVSSARLYVGNTLLATGTVGQTINFTGNPIATITKGQAKLLELKGSFGFSWEDPGNNGGPHIKFSAPTITARGVNSGVDCESSLAQTYPSGHYPTYGFDLEKLGTVKVESRNDSDGTLYCNTEDVALEFSLRTFEEESATLQQVTVRFDDFGLCPDFSGRARLLADDGSSYGPVDIDMKAAVFAVGGAEGLITAPPRSFRLYLTFDHDACPASDRRVRPYIAADGIVAIGNDTGRTLSVETPVKEDWQRELTLVQEAATRYTVELPGPVAIGANERQTVAGISLGALCEEVRDGRLTIKTTPRHNFGYDIDSLFVHLSGAIPDTSIAYYWKGLSDNDLFTTDLPLPLIPPNQALDISVALKTVRNGFNPGTSDLELTANVSRPFPIATKAFKVYFQSDPLLSMTACTPAADSTFAPDHTGILNLLSFDLFASGLAPGESFTLNELSPTWLENNGAPSTIFTTLHCYVDGTERATANASANPPKFIFQVGNRPEFENWTTHTITITGDLRDSEKSGSYRLGVAINATTVKLSDAVTIAEDDCAGAKYNFSQVETLEVCACQPQSTDEVVWVHDAFVTLYKVRLVKSGAAHEVQLDKLSITLEDPSTAPSFLNNCDLTDVSFWTSIGCNEPALDDITAGNTAFDVTTGTLTIFPNNYTIVAPDETPHYILIKVKGDDEAGFENGLPFRFGSPTGMTYDKEIQQTAALTPCAPQPLWPAIRPRINGWVDLTTRCQERNVIDPHSWTVFYEMTLTPQKEDLSPLRITIPLDPAHTFVDLSAYPEGNDIRLALFDSQGNLMTSEKPMTNTTEIVFEPGDFLGDAGDLNRSDGSQTWYLKLRIPQEQEVSSNNEDECITIAHARLKDTLTFTGSYTYPDVISGRGNPQECYTCFGKSLSVSVVHDTLASRHVQPGERTVALYRDIVSPGRENAAPLRVVRFAYAFREHPSGWNTGAFAFSLHRSLDGVQYTEIHATHAVREDSLVFEVDSAYLDDGNVPTTGSALFEVWVDVNACDADDNLQLASGVCGAAYRARTQAENLVVSVACDEDTPPVGPLMTFDPGPCTADNARSRFASAPEYIYSGVPFDVTLALHDASGVVNTGGNAIPGVSKDEFQIEWFYNNERRTLTPVWATPGATDSRGEISCALTIEGQVVGDTEGEITCKVRGNECDFSTAPHFRAGTPVDSLSSIGPVWGGDYDNYGNYRVLTVEVAAKDAVGNLLSPDYFDITLDAPTSEEIWNPSSLSEDPRIWTFARSKGAANVVIPVTVTPKELPSSFSSTMQIPVRVPEYSAPTFEDSGDIDVSMTGQSIQVSGLTVADSNDVSADREFLRAYLLLRPGWTDGPADTSNFQENVSSQDPRGGVPLLTGTYVVPGAFGNTRSIDYRIAALDRDNNISYYPEEGFKSLLHGISETEGKPAPALQGDWRYFSIPDSFPGQYPGVPEGAFGEMISSHGQPARDKWAVAEYDGNGVFTYFKKKGEPLLSEISIGRGYWIAGAEQREIKIKLTAGSTQPTHREVPVEVRIGDWTSLGNPFNFKLTSADLERASIRYLENGNDVVHRLYDPELHQYAEWFRLLVPYVNEQVGGVDYDKYGNVSDSSYKDPTQWSMDAWKASYFYLSPGVFGDRRMVRLIWAPPDAPVHPLGRIDEVSPSVDARVPAAPPAPRWFVRLTATGPEGTRGDPLTIRSFDNGRDELDLYDSPRAPDLGGGAHLGLTSFPDADPLAWRMPLEIDTRSASDSAQIVTFYLMSRGDLSGIAKVSWDEAVLPSGWTGRIVDELDRQVNDIAGPGSMEVPLVAQDATVTLRLVLAPVDQLDSAIASILRPGPGTLELLPPTPNPCTSMTRVRYALPEAVPMSLQIYDVQGRKIRTLFEGVPAGVGLQTVLWDTRDDAGNRASAGVYWIRLDAGGKARKSTIVILR